MTWTITPTNLLPDDADAVAYIAAVEAADGEALEPAVKLAYNSFIKSCKADGIWPSIKASCILAGARTLNGALVPLVGAAPTNYNFVAGDYNRKTGLVGDGSTKYLDSNRNNNADPQNSNHNSAFLSTVQQTNAVIMAAADPVTAAGAGGNVIFTSGATRSRANTASASLTPYPAAGFIGVSRQSSAGYTLRHTSTDIAISIPSDGLLSQNVLIYRRQSGSSFYTNSRLAFYSIGEALNLALLDARVTALVNALAAAIP
jgi:hypothetical protein